MIWSATNFESFTSIDFRSVARSSFAFFRGHRAGHIPRAHNVPAPANLDRVTQTLLPASELTRLWEPLGLQPGRRVITYCGGGVFGAFALFTLYVMGHENAALYDASWMEWGADPERPIETGASSAMNEHDQHKQPRKQ